MAGLPNGMVHTARGLETLQVAAPWGLVTAGAPLAFEQRRVRVPSLMQQVGRDPMDFDTLSSEEAAERHHTSTKKGTGIDAKST